MEDLSNLKISENLKLGLFTLVSIRDHSKSNVFKEDSFQKMFDGEKLLAEKFACSECYKVYSYNRKIGTSNLIRHQLNCEKTFRKLTVTNYSERDVKNIRQQVIEKLVNLSLKIYVHSPLFKELDSEI